MGVIQEGERQIVFAFQALEVRIRIQSFLKSCCQCAYKECVAGLPIPDDEAIVTLFAHEVGFPYYQSEEIPTYSNNVNPIMAYRC